MVRSRWSRPVAALIAAAVVIAGCSSDDDSSPATTGAESAPTTEEVSAPTTEAGLTGEGLDLALLAPSPGLLATLFQGQVRGADFAVEDVNDGGGVLDGPLSISSSVAEAGADPAANVTAAVDGGAQALIGPAGSSGGIEVRDELVALDSTACSASATVPSLTLGQDPLALFRTAVPDDVTAAYLAGQIINRRDETAPDAAWKVAIVAHADAYGQSVGNTMAAVLRVGRSGAHGRRLQPPTGPVRRHGRGGRGARSRRLDPRHLRGRGQPPVARWSPPASTRRR